MPFRRFTHQYSAFSARRYLTKFATLTTLRIVCGYGRPSTVKAGGNRELAWKVGSFRSWTSFYLYSCCFPRSRSVNIYCEVRKDVNLSTLLNKTALKGRFSKFKIGLKTLHLQTPPSGIININAMNIRNRNELRQPHILIRCEISSNKTPCVHRLS